ncbi:MAG: diguanylate cyclase domain-containing protein [Gammaproteobacteria bacterium]
MAQSSMNGLLAGLANRINFNRNLTTEFRLAKLEKEPLSLIMRDIDYFNANNDSYGAVAVDFISSSRGLSTNRGQFRSASDFVETVENVLCRTKRRGRNRIEIV